MITAYDFDVYQGQNFSLSLTVRDNNGVPLDLTNYAISGFIKVNLTSTPISSLNAQITTPTSGIVSLSIPPSGTASLPVDYLFYDVSIDNYSGSAQKILLGKISVYPEVSF